MKSQLITQLLQSYDAIPFSSKNRKIKSQFHVIRKSNNYMCVRNRDFIFLDVSNFIPPRYSYSKLLKAYSIDQGKGFFPYSFLTCKERLDYPLLPPYQGGEYCPWYDSLKDCDLLSREHNLWIEGGKLGSEPPSGIDNYKYLQKIWIDHDMKTLKDLLIW